jgi:hypothetical protein
MLCYATHQASIAPLLPRAASNRTEFTIIRDLNATARSGNAAEATQQLTDIFISAPLASWQQHIKDLDMPNYYFTFAAFVCYVLTLVLPADASLVDDIFSTLASVFNLPADAAAFIEGSFLPTLRRATSDLQLTRLERLGLGLKMTGVCIKMLYAFIWQEWVLPWQRIYGKAVNRLGAALMPAVNSLANLLTGWVHTDPVVQEAGDIA